MVVLLIVVFFKVRKLQREKNALETENHQLALNDHHSENIIRNLDKEISVQRAIISDKESMIESMDEQYRELEDRLVCFSDSLSITNRQLIEAQEINALLHRDLEEATKP